MPSATRSNKIVEQAARAGEALAAGKVFEAERHALKALMLARQDNDFQGMTKIIPGLMEARIKRLRDAMKGAKVSIVEGPVPEDIQPKKGCYLVQPPQVGADARRLRIAALERGVCVAVVCREPLTQLKLVPVVAISPGMTLRTCVEKPRNLDKPDLEWMSEAIEALGEFAVESLDPDMIPQRRVDALLERLDALPEHQGLHQALVQACLEAHAAEIEAQAARALRKKAKSAGNQPRGEGGDNDDDDAALDAENDLQAEDDGLDDGGEAQ
jgi:hypothetical protein